MIIGGSMGRLTISCDQAVSFLKENKFKIMDTLKDFQFDEDVIRVKLKVHIFRPWLKLELQRYENGVLLVKAGTKNFLKVLADIFVDIEQSLDKALGKEKLNQFIDVEEDLVFRIEVNKFLAVGIKKFKGIDVKNIQLKNQKLHIDFTVLPVV